MNEPQITSDAIDLPPVVSIAIPMPVEPDRLDSQLRAGRADGLYQASVADDHPALPSPSTLH